MDLNIRLTRQPFGNVTVTLTESHVDLTLNKTSLTFTTSNWNSYQTVEATAEEDADFVPEVVTVNVSATVQKCLIQPRLLSPLTIMMYKHPVQYATLLNLQLRLTALHGLGRP